MRIVIVGLLLVAVIIAGGTAFLVRDFLKTQQAPQVEKVEPINMVKVLVAKQDLPTGSAITLEGVEWLEWPEKSITPNYVTETEGFNFAKEFSGTIVRHAISKGEPVAFSKLFKSDVPGFLAGTITPGMRVVSVAVDAVSGAQGFIFPGDRVDLILTHNIVSLVIGERQEEESVSQMPIVVQNTSETILRNLRVIAIDQKVSEFESQALLARTVALEVTPKQAEIIQTAKAMGKLTLVLRSLAPGEADGVSGVEKGTYTTDVEVSPMLSNLGSILEAQRMATQTMVPLTISPPSPPVVEEPKSKPAEEAPSGPVVKVYRGGKGSIEEIGGSSDKTKAAAP